MIEIKIVEVLAIFGGITGIISFFVSLRHQNRKSDGEAAATLARIEATLKHISEQINPLQNDLRKLNGELGELRERVRAAEESLKSAHYRVGEISKK